MRYYYKFFLWENGQKGAEYSNRIVAPIFFEDHLDETMDSGEVILDAMPIATRNAFPPKTKVRLERYTTKDFTDQPKTYDLVVEHDDVEEYAGVPTICTHRIHLIEASVVAQGMHPDNFALTYELQDVDLNYKTVAQDDTPIGDAAQSMSGGYNSAISAVEDTNYSPNWHIAYFRKSYRYVWDDTSLNSIKSLFKEISAAQANEITFTVPKLMCQGCYNPGVWADLFEMNTVTRVYEIKTLNGAEVSRTTATTKYSGATVLPVKNDIVFYSNGTWAALRSILTWEGRRAQTIHEFEKPANWEMHPTLASANSAYADKTVSFTTTQLSDAEIASGYALIYQIESIPFPSNLGGMVQYYVKKHSGRYFEGSADLGTSTTETVSNELADPTVIRVTASFTAKDMSSTATGGAFLMKGRKYNAYDLLRRALLTIDAQVIDNSKTGLDKAYLPGTNDPDPNNIQYPIIFKAQPAEDAENWEERLKAASVQETIFEGKNLWEVLIQIGYYLHAVPYLEFADDGTDRFALSFRQLGATKVKQDTNTKITVFNSKNLAEFFTQYDSYVTNLFSPQNIVDEWVVPKTSDSTYLVSNDTAEIHTKYPIIELLEFDITYDGSGGGNAGTASAVQSVFEESVYRILSAENPLKITPSKGGSLYFTFGDNKIKGLNYTPPTGTGVTWTALKEICRRLFTIQPGNPFDNLQFNALKFHVRYRTQDSLRLSQVRPDLKNFMKNSSYEKYPHHEQYYGQQDKIVDSERFTANLFGRLIRVGNAVYQRQEYVKQSDEKESGDLVSINGETYYVTATENEYYADCILQKVTYSKNFNQLANIVTIPSEPRFYEVSERSKIRREVRIMEFFSLSTARNTRAGSPRFLNNDTWKSLLKKIIFAREDNAPADGLPVPSQLPNYAYTNFMADTKRVHTGSYGQFVPPEQLFPSSEIDRTDPNNITPVEPSGNADCIVPLMHFPMHDGIVFEWDMEDNFSAGDFVDAAQSGGSGNNAYMSMQPMRYVDVMGRADLFLFKLFYVGAGGTKTDWTTDEARQLPKAVYMPSDAETAAQVPDGMAIGLDKDCREELSFNYQINLLHRASEDDDDFITFPNIFGTKDSPLKMCFLSETQSLFNENLNLSSARVLADDVTYQLLDDSLNAIELRITKPSGVDMSEVKSIVLYQSDEIGGRAAYIVKNVAKLPDEDKLQSWWIYPEFNTDEVT